MPLLNIIFSQLSSGVLPNPVPLSIDPNANPNAVPAPPPISPDEQAMLNKLADIDIPDPISWWPPSISLCILLSFLIAAFILITYAVIRKRRANEYKRLALIEFNRIDSKLDSLDAPTTVFELTKLLKRTIYTLDIQLKRKIASLQGAAWFNYLDSTLAKQHSFKASNNSDALYSIEYAAPSTEGKSENTQIVEAYKSFCKHWLQHHSKAQLYIQLNTEGSNQ